MSNNVMSYEPIPRMNPEAKAKWVNALRSGEYIQTSGALRSIDGFCCLGVLCDTIDKSKWVSRDDYTFYYSSKYYFNDICLPSHIMNEVRITTDSGLISELIDRFGSSVTLADLNDHFDGLTFNQIADVIEYFF